MFRLLIAIGVFLSFHSVGATEEPIPAAGDSVASSGVGDAGAASGASTALLETKRKKSKGRVSREKDTEGTQAPNHFDKDILFKSKYELDGKPLEVDTD